MSPDSKIDHIAERIASIDTTLKFQSKQLEEHIKRTTMLEQRFEPVEDHVKFVQGLLKALIYLSSISGIILVVIKLVGHK